MKTACNNTIIRFFEKTNVEVVLPEKPFADFLQSCKAKKQMAKLFYNQRLNHSLSSVILHLQKKKQIINMNLI